MRHQNISVVQMDSEVGNVSAKLEHAGGLVNATAQLTRIDGGRLPILPTSIGLTNIESQIRYRITERIIR
jgi:hypothetical protein